MELKNLQMTGTKVGFAAFYRTSCHLTAKTGIFDLCFFFASFPKNSDELLSKTAIFRSCCAQWVQGKFRPTCGKKVPCCMCPCTSSSWPSEAENSNTELSSRYRVHSHEPYLKSIAKRRTFLALFYHSLGTAEYSGLWLADTWKKSVPRRSGHPHLPRYWKLFDPSATWQVFS